MANRVVDLYIIYQIIKRIGTPFEDTDAFKAGLIDAKGKKLRKATSSEDKKALTYFDRFVFNIKRLIWKVPGGKSTVGSYAAAMLLIKEHTGMSDKKIKEVIEEALGHEFEPVDIYESSWFMRDDELMPGTYMLLNDHLDNLNK